MAERIFLAAFVAVLVSVGAFTALAWLYGETAAKGCFQVATAGAMIGGPAVWYGNRRHLTRRREIMLTKASREAGFKLFSGAQNVIAVDMAGARPVFSQYAITSAGSRATGSPQPVPVAPAPQPAIEYQDRQPLLPVLLGLDRILVIGGMGAGKSELLRHLAYRRSMQGETVVIDSHSAPGDWPDSCRVVGRGRQYRQIEAEMSRIMGEMDRRYKLRSSGHGGAFAPLSLIIDELTVLNQFCDVGDEMKALLCECRKVAIRIIFAGQSDRAGALGLKGNNDLRAGFEALVYLEREAGGERIATVMAGTDKQGRRFVHPGPFPKACLSVSPVYASETPIDRGFSGDRQTDGQDRQTPRIDYREGAEAFAQCFTGPAKRIFESRDERRIVDLFESGFSPSGIAAEIWGSQNGRRTKAVKTVLAQHGIEA